MHALRIDHVSKRYGRETVVKDLEFEVRPGIVTGFLGPNGAGKSTTMKVLLDLAAADQGRATIGGTRYRDLDEPARTVGVVLEANAFHPGRSGRDHLRILADGAGVPNARVDEVLGLVDLERAADRNVRAYSLGMRQRLSLAGALLGDPPVLVLDEPGNGLDPQGIRWLRDLLRVRAGAGHTIFVSSHLLAEIEHLADEVVVIDHGELVASGAISELRNVGTLVRTPATSDMTVELETAGATVRQREDGALVVQGLRIDEIGDRAHAAGLPLHELSSQSGSLEDLFLDWTGGEKAITPDEARGGEDRT
jgi:ABC-2 type transport system ATP-binding protein